MSETLLILGAGGMLGYPTFLEARRRHGDRAHGTYRTPLSALAGLPNLHRLDLRDSSATEQLLHRLRPAWIVNCAGIVKSRCDQPCEAIALNAALPHFMAQAVAEWGGRIIQISTDCVFSGKKGNYTETDSADPQDLYGLTNLLGELHEPPHLTIRTSFIGIELASERGLLAWFLSQRGRVPGFRRAIWSGVTANFLATAIHDLLQRRELTGLLNVGGEPIDKFHLLRQLAEAFDKRDVTIEPVDRVEIDRSLDTRRLRDLGLPVPPLREMLRDLHRWRDAVLDSSATAPGPKPTTEGEQFA